MTDHLSDGVIFLKNIDLFLLKGRYTEKRRDREEDLPSTDSLHK